MARYTTFCVAEIVGPFLSFGQADAALTAGDVAEYLRLSRLANRIVAFHRPGIWRAERLHKLAARMGVVMVSAEAVPRDSKGFLDACAVKIIVAGGC
ncbi:MAG: hypothetical protein QM569_04120 [Acidovorax sp.]|uniref:hypothetical protein n=1 Tax=Acidovorax sp. TaxID=1872122 RepID=UPI0039E6AFAB